MRIQSRSLRWFAVAVTTLLALVTLTVCGEGPDPPEPADITGNTVTADDKRAPINGLAVICTQFFNGQPIVSVASVTGGVCRYIALDGGNASADAVEFCRQCQTSPDSNPNCAGTLGLFDCGEAGLGSSGGVPFHSKPLFHVTVDFKDPRTLFADGGSGFLSPVDDGGTVDTFWMLRGTVPFDGDGGALPVFQDTQVLTDVREHAWVDLKVQVSPQ